MLTGLIFFTLIAGIFTAFTGKHARTAAIAVSAATFAISLVMLMGFETVAGYQYVQQIPWIPDLGIVYHVGVDGISVLLIMLTTFLTPLIILSADNAHITRPGLFYSLILTMEAALIGVFCALDGFLFYIFWELALIPIYFICLLWGGNNRVRITLKFFIYTLSGSLLMLVALIWLWLQTPDRTFDIAAFYALQLSPQEQSYIFWGFFLAFAVKIPVFPLHTWQPDTYTDSPVSGTMLLAGIMLKMGLYGLLRWLLPVAPDGVEEWKWLAITLSVTGVVYASLIAWVQKDFKRLIAYSSIAHVGLISAGIFTITIQGMQGGILQMVTHGINVTGLFFIADMIMRRTGTREIGLLSGIRNLAPVFATYFILFVLASVGLPLTNGFVGEFLLIAGLYQYEAWFAAIGGLTIILSAVYMFNAYRHMMHGDIADHTMKFPEITKSEQMVLIPLVIMIFWIGVYPKYFFDITAPSVKALQEIILRNTVS